MKVGIIGGAGLVGSTTAFYLGIEDIVSEIVLIDIKENMMLAHYWDMEQAVMDVSKTKMSGGGWESLAGCDIVVHSASVDESKTASRDECLEVNCKIVKQAAENIMKYCPKAIVVMAANPVDVLNYAMHHYTGLPSNRCIGFSRNDSLRLRWAISKLENVDIDSVSAMSIGEHGFATVPIYSNIVIDGIKKSYNSSSQAIINDMVINFFTRYQALKSGRSSGWTSAVSLVQVCKQIILGSKEPVACSAILNGEYGVYGISIGVPVYLGSNGIEKIIEIQMNDEEKEKFYAAVEKTTVHVQNVVVK